jgi:hypothetical protein
MISVSLDLQQALRRGHATRHAFVQLDHPLGLVQIWSGTGSVTWNGATWLGVGALGAVGEVSETKEIQAHDMNLELSGINAATVTLQDGQVRGRAVSIWSRWIDLRTGAWFSDSAVLFSGLMDVVKTAERNGIATMTLTCRSPLFNWDAAPSVYYSNEEQLRLYPGDTGFDRMPNIPTQTLAGWNLT